MKIRELRRKIESMGFTFVSNNRHFKYRSPKGNILVFSSSPTCQFAFDHALRDAEKILKKENKDEVQ